MKWYRRAGAHMFLPILGFLFVLATMSAQTRVDLRSQTKNVDFSNAVSTRPFPVGSALPATCQVGETWFKPDAPAGQNVFICAATNTWSEIRYNAVITAPYSTVRSLGAGPYLNVVCTSGTEATTGECTLAVDTSNLATPDSNNVLSGITSFPATPVQSLSSGSTILCNATRVAVSATSAVTLTSTPVIADPVRDGQVCIIQNTGSNDITLTSGSSQNLKLAAETVILKAGQPIMLIWDQGTSLWTQTISVATPAPDSNTVLSGITSFPATPVQSLSSGSTILCNATRVAVSATSAITLTSTPVIADPVRDGQVCIIQNTGSNDITLTSGSSQNLKLAAETVILKAGQPIMLIWDQGTSLWTQTISVATPAPDSNTVLSGITSFPATPVQSLSSGSTILCNATRVAVSATSAITLTSTPVIADPVRDGQMCIIQNTGSNDLTLTSGSSQNLKLAAETVILKAGQPIMLIWDQGTSLWTQTISVATPAPVASPASTNPKAVVQTLSTTPVCNNTAGLMTTLTIPSGLTIGQTARITVHVGKTSGDSMQFRIKHATLNGTEIAYLSLGGTSQSGAVILEVTQFSPTLASTISVSAASTAASSSFANEITRNSGDPLVLSITQASCATAGQSAFIKSATASIVEAP